MIDYQDFQAAIQELESFYGGKILNGGILEATWYECFKNVSVEDLNYAISKCFRYNPRQYNYFPSPEEIRKLLFDSQENYQASKVVQASDFILPSEDSKKANQRNMIWRLYLHYKFNKKVGTSEKDREDFFERFKDHSIAELELLISLEVNHITKNVKVDPLTSNEIDPKAKEYLMTFSNLVRGIN
ncbi:MAG: hypothetical protein ACKPJO_09825 [Dolichospermum sp.]